MADSVYVPKIEITPMDQHNVSTGSAGWVSGTNVILEQFNAVSGIVSSQTTRVNEYLDTAELMLKELVMPTGWTDVLGTVVINPVPGIDTTGIPVPGSLSLPGFNSVVFSPMPALPVVPALDLTYTEPVEPDEVNPSFDYMMSTYTSAMWTDLFNKVQDGIINGGTGIPTAIETAINERNLFRQQAANDTAYAQGVSTISSRTLSFPQYAMQNLANQMATEILRQTHNSSNEIAISMADLAQKNTHFMITSAISLETILRDFWKTFETLSIQAKTALTDFILRNYAEKNKAYIAKWEGIVASLRAKVEGVNAVVAQYVAVVSGFKAQMDGSIAQIDAISKERDSLVKAASLDVDIYKARVDGETAWYNALSENQKAQLQYSELQLRKLSEQLKAQLDSFISLNSLKEKILSTLGATSAQVMASALNAVNTSVGATSSSSASVSESFSHGESQSISLDQKLDEGHSFSHKGRDE
jgi:hypothetical protein